MEHGRDHQHYFSSTIKRGKDKLKTATAKSDSSRMCIRPVEQMLAYATVASGISNP